jgi:hypothetical protein
MSDPTQNDYSPAPALTPVQEYRALLTLVSVDAAAKPMEGAASVHELIEMLGLDGRANELRAQRGLRAVPKVAPVSVAVRDSYGRLRGVTAPATDVPDPVPVGQHGHNGRCASGDHAWTPENIGTVAATGAQRCKPCEQRRKRGGSSRKPSDAPVLCRCPGRKHELTEESSESTYVAPDGKRQCRVGMDRRNQAEQVVPPGVVLGPGEKLCRCEGVEKKHVLTPYSSTTTYVDPQGHMRCRVMRANRKSNQRRRAA